MKTASEYRALAEECFTWARQAKREEVRESYMQLAQVWLNAASLLDGAPPTRMAPPKKRSKAASGMRGMRRAVNAAPRARPATPIL